MGTSLSFHRSQHTTRQTKHLQVVPHLQVVLMFPLRGTTPAVVPRQRLASPVSMQSIHTSDRIVVVLTSPSGYQVVSSIKKWSTA